MRISGIWGVSLVLLAVSGLDGQTPRSVRVNVGDHELHFRLSEPTTATPGGPVIILEAGGGNDSRFWSAVQPKIADQFGVTVVAYDRAGHGQSTLPPLPYDIRNEVRSLRTALMQLQAGKQFLFVSHSYGGLLSHLYASTWPESVRGILFLDPQTAGAWISPLPQIVPKELVLPPPTSRLDSAMAGVLRGFNESLLTVYRSPLPSNIPIVVVSAEKGPFPDKRHSEAVILNHKLLATASVRGRWVLADRAGHNVIDTREDLLISLLKEMMAGQ